MSAEINKQQVGGDHYQAEVSPWDLQRAMKTSGSIFADCRRADAIRYAFRVKGDRKKMIEDMKKARHYLDAGIEELERLENANPKP